MALNGNAKPVYADDARRWLITAAAVPEDVLVYNVHLLLPVVVLPILHTPASESRTFV